MIDLRFKEYKIVGKQFGYKVTRISMKDGKPVVIQAKQGDYTPETLVGYFNDLDQCLVAVTNDRLRSGKEIIKTVPDFKKYLDKYYNELKDFIHSEIPEKF